MWRWLKRITAFLAVLILGLLAPVAYNEVACRGSQPEAAYASLLPPEHHRAETRTLMTYPEWHIVHAYDDYAQVIRTGDPHEYGFLRGIAGFWGSLCSLSQQASVHGTVDRETKRMVYVIGVSFTAELLAKAAYEETLGRLFALMRGPERAEIDDLSAEQATAYAAFLQQVPWHQWDFRGDIDALKDSEVTGTRNTERRVALGIEYGIKARYADAIAAAVASLGADELTLRMVVRGPLDDALDYEGVTVIEETPEGTVIETIRYRALTGLLAQMAEDGLDVIEIAGNDDIMFTALSDQPEAPGAIYSAPRQGYGDYRHLILLKVPDLMDRLRALDGLRLEHIHDY